MLAAEKDEAVILCAEETVLRLEKCLIAFTTSELSDPDGLMKRLRSRADEMAPTMCFFASVCVSDRYKDDMKPTLDRLSMHEGLRKSLNVMQMRLPHICI